MIKFTFEKIYLLIFLVFLSGCMKDMPDEINTELPVFDTQGLVGPAGGIVKIMDKSSPIYGSYVAIGEGALDNFVQISIKQAVNPDTSFVDSNKIFIEFLPTGTNFKKPVEIGTVYKNGNLDSLQQFVYDSLANFWFPIPFRRLDNNKKLVVGLTTHFSTYTTFDNVIRDIYFPDSGLDQAVRETIYKIDNEVISLGDVYTIDGLDAGKYEIKDLTGIKYLHYLRLADFSENQITSLSPLSQNYNLQIVALNDNQISDISPLSNLTLLKTITLDHNKITDILPLKTLKKLESIALDNNQISDLSPLSTLTTIKNITLYKNNISNISPLANLYKLEGLDIDHNQISQIPALNNLTKLKSINLGENPITNPENLSTAKNLQTIILDSCKITSFPNLPGLDSLKSLSVKFNSIHFVSELSGFKNLEYLSFMGNKLEDIDNLSPLINLKVLDLDENDITGKLKLKDFKKLTVLSLVDNNLGYSEILGNIINNLEELKFLTELNELYLDKNHLLGLGNLENLKKLTTITLDKNYNDVLKSALSDISFLGALPNLKTVSARFNSIENISCFDGNMKLQHLDLDTNRVENLIPLGKNYGIEFLSLNGNKIKDIELLLGNPGLDYGDQLFLRDNPLSNAAIHEHIPILHDRGVKVVWKTFTKFKKSKFLNYKN